MTLAFLEKLTNRAISSVRNIRLVNKFIFMYIFIILLPILFVSYYSYIRFTNNTIEEYCNMYSNINELLLKNLQFHFNEMDNLCNSIVYNTDITDLIQIGKNSTFAPEYSHDTILSTQLIDSFILSNMIQPSCLDFGIYTLDGRIYHKSKYGLPINNSTQKNYTESSWFKEALEKDGRSFLLGTHVQMQVNNGERVFSMVKLLKSSNFDKIGVVLIDYDLRVFKNIFDMVNIPSSDNIIVADENGNIVFEKNEDKTNQKIESQLYESIYTQNKKSFLYMINGKKSYVASSTDIKTGWHFISVLSYENLVKKFNSIQRLIIFVIILVLIIISLLYFMLVRTVFNPIRGLSRKMLAAAGGDLTIRFNSESKDEVGMIGTSFNQLVSSISNLVENQKQFQIKIRDKEIQSLQAQINPHFMYNTLNTIKWMSIEIKAEKIKKMIESLVSLLKNTIYREGRFISLNDEIKNLTNFIYIQNIRYDNRFKFVFNIDTETEKCFILKMLLQPIVENSIFHGFENENLTDCLITISCKKENNKVIIEISDNGRGMDEAALMKIISSSESSRKRFSGIGLLNVEERIKLNYGDEYGMEIQSVPDKETVVRLTLPYLNTGEDIDNVKNNDC